MHSSVGQRGRTGETEAPIEDDVAPLLRDVLSHPGWALMEDQLVKMAHVARLKAQGVLKMTDPGGVALLSINAAATRDTISAFLSGIYQRAGVTLPKSVRDELQ